ncbi:MAG TPA: DUF3461 family protein [Albidovulum sp.]|uniref:DUF3461 family protein n=1 Tax=Albidovulum sp. TaxID=1872424 RepID=UPI002C3ECB4F|nr:DUF3461 family protein [Albidovulum sp.]
MPDRFPTLTAMGVTSPDQIASYDLIDGESHDDILKLRYQRPAGSFLPVTRVYHFARTPRASDSAAGMVDYEIAPTLSAALLELDRIVADKTERKVAIAEIRARISALDGEIRAELRSLQTALKRLEELG